MYTAISLVAIFGIAAMAIDIGMVYSARAEMQRSADAAALSGTWTLPDDRRMLGSGQIDEMMADARQDAADMGHANAVLTDNPEIDSNGSNATNGDIVIGYLETPENLGAPLEFGTPSLFNSVQVRVRRDEERNGGIMTFFARILGHEEITTRVLATATARDGISGWRITETSGNVGILPIALKDTSWNNLLNGSVTTGDLYTYNPDTGTVSNGPDGIKELNLYPGAGATQLPPGNFGTVDIGSPNNSTSDISRQIRYGMNESDLSYFGGELNLMPAGYIMLNGDTGLSAAIKDDLEAIKGQPRAIPIFNHVQRPGNNSYFRVIAFGGIRIMNVRLTGSMRTKQVIIQPAVVVDDAAVSSDGFTSYYIYRPPELTR